MISLEGLSNNQQTLTATHMHLRNEKNTKRKLFPLKEAVQLHFRYKLQILLYLGVDKDGTVGYLDRLFKSI